MDDQVQSLVVNKGCQLDIYRYPGCEPWQLAYQMYWGYSIPRSSYQNIVVKEIEDTNRPLKYFNKNIRCVWCSCKIIVETVETSH